jgi:hypothetical protein
MAINAPLSLIKKLVKDSRKHLNELSPEQKAALEYYQGSSNINWGLRDPVKGNPYLHKILEAHVLELDRIFKEGPRMPEDMLLYRSAPRGVYPGIDHAYLSTSLDENLARDLLGITGEDDLLYRIMAPEGTPYMMPLDTDPTYKFQKEVILPRKGFLDPHDDGLRNLLKYRNNKYAAGGLVKGGLNLIKRFTKNEQLATEAPGAHLIGSPDEVYPNAAFAKSFGTPSGTLLEHTHPNNTAPIPSGRDIELITSALKAPNKTVSPTIRVANGRGVFEISPKVRMSPRKYSDAIMEATLAGGYDPSAVATMSRQFPGESDQWTKTGLLNAKHPKLNIKYTKGGR